MVLSTPPPLNLSQTPLFSLPLELRLHILSYAVSLPDLTSRPKDVDKSSSRPCHLSLPKHTPSILLVCRQLTAEALDALLTATLMVPSQLHVWGRGPQDRYNLQNYMCDDFLQRVRFVQLEVPYWYGVQSYMRRILLGMLVGPNRVRRITLCIVRIERSREANLGRARDAGILGLIAHKWAKTPPVALPIVLAWDAPATTGDGIVRMREMNAAAGGVELASNFEAWLDGVERERTGKHVQLARQCLSEA